VTADPVGAARPGDGGHLRPEPGGQLHRVTADATAGAVDQDPLSRPQLGVLEDRLPGGQSDQRQRGGVGEIDRCRSCGEQVGRGRDELGGGAGTVRRKEPDHPIPRLPPGHPGPGRGDHPGDVDVRDVRERQRDHLAHDAEPDRRVEQVERRPGDLDHHLPRPGLRLLGLLVHRWFAVPVIAHRLHETSDQMLRI